MLLHTLWRRRVADSGSAGRFQGQLPGAVAPGDYESAHVPRITPAGVPKRLRDGSAILARHRRRGLRLRWTPRGSVALRQILPPSPARGADGQAVRSIQAGRMAVLH